MAIVVFSSAQRAHVGGDARVEIEAERVVDLIEALHTRYPELEGKLDGAAVAIDGDIHQDARYLRLRPDSEVHFMGAVAGGSGRGIDADERSTGRVDSGEPPDSGSEARWIGAGADPLIAARDRLVAGRRVALATVLETWGSSPCPPGSQLVVDERGGFEGSVSGGCVESAVIEAAFGVIERGESEILEFGVADEEAWSVGLACGGRVRIRVEPVE